MFNYYGLSRRLAKERDAAIKSAQVYKDEAARLRKKLEARTDFFVEREMRIFDRFLTSQVKTFAITDEIKAKQITQEDVDSADLEAFLAEKKAFLVSCAKEAGIDDPQAAAEATYNQNYSLYKLEFEAG